MSQKLPSFLCPVLDAATYASRGSLATFLTTNMLEFASISCQMLCPILTHTWHILDNASAKKSTSIFRLLRSIYVQYFQSHAYAGSGNRKLRLHASLCRSFRQTVKIANMSPSLRIEASISEDSSQTTNPVSFCQLR